MARVEPICREHAEIRSVVFADAEFGWKPAGVTRRVAALREEMHVGEDDVLDVAGVFSVWQLEGESALHGGGIGKFIAGDDWRGFALLTVVGRPAGFVAVGTATVDFGDIDA